jgi:hypothetical protein
VTGHDELHEERRDLRDQIDLRQHRGAHVRVLPSAATI